MMNRELYRCRKILARVRARQAELRELPDEAIAALTGTFRERRRKGESLDRLLPEAFAAVCEADRRILHKDPYDVQILGAIALHDGCLAEIGTGEGKTLTATMPLYLNAIDGQGAILVTTNDYLAIRDYTEMSPVYRFLGLSAAVGVRRDAAALTNKEKKEIYAADIVYTTHGALGFDYLFNNLVTSAGERFLRPFHYIIIDEADSVLLDSSQTPLVISGSPRVQSNLYPLADTFVTLLREGVEYETEDNKVWLTPEGIRRAQEFFEIDNLYADRNAEINRHVILALRAHTLFRKGREYTLANDGSLTLLDTGTGRIMPGVKLRGGQHQALEVKEGLPESVETRSVASITYQNLFLLFDKMSGMSGTILDNKRELEKIYGTKVVAIPPNRPVIRRDLPDVYLYSADEKFERAVASALEIHATGRPVLVVASTIEETERVSRALIRNRIPHNVLNANNAYWEASIIAEAGRRDAVTVATAMAGRGTDIRLGDTVEELGGLAVIGIGRMANRRMERQVRGRAGRQGDPGSSQFFVSLADEVVTRNQIDQVERCASGRRPGAGGLRRIINRAQALEEEDAARARENSMKYDQVMKKQRNLIYALRDRLLDGGTIPEETLRSIAEENIRGFVHRTRHPDQAAVNRYILDNLSCHVGRGEELPDPGNRKQLVRYLEERARQSLEEQKRHIGNDRATQSFLRIAVLHAIDEAWVEQVDYLQQLQSAVLGRSYAQRNVVDEFQNEAFDAYRSMERRIKESVMRTVLLSTVYVGEQSRLHIVFR